MPETKKPRIDENSTEGLSTVEGVNKQIQEKLAAIEAIEDSLHSLEDDKAEQVLKLEKEFEQKQLPYYKKRAQIIKELPNFWTTSLLQHPQLSSLVDDNDEEVFQHLTSIDVQTIDDSAKAVGEEELGRVLNFKINFEFSENDYFENTNIYKAFYQVGEDVFSESNEIKWKQGKNLLLQGGQAENGAGDKRALETESFFTWFTDHADAVHDEVADTLKDDLFMNALNYYLNEENSDEEEDENDEVDLKSSDEEDLLKEGDADDADEDME